MDVTRSNLSSDRNVTTLTTNSSTNWFLLTPIPTAMQVLLLGLAAVIVTTNVVIIVLYSRSRKSRKQMGIFLLNLAIVDLQNGLLSLPFLVFYPRSSLYETTDIPPVCCVLLVTWPQILYTVAYQSVCLVTIERFISVSKPFLYARMLVHKKTCLLVVLIVWLVVIFISLLPIIDYIGIGESGLMVLCNETYKAGIIYLQVFFSCMIILPLIIILTLYVLMYRVARKHLKELEKLNMPSPSPTTPNSPVYSSEHSIHELKFTKSPVVRKSRSNGEIVRSNITAQLRRLSSSEPVLTPTPLIQRLRRRFLTTQKKTHFLRKSRAAKTTASLCMFYVISWLPFTILVQVNSMCTVYTCNDVIYNGVIQTAMPYTMFLAFLSSAVNPVIYIFRNKTVRREMNKILCRCQQRMTSLPKTNQKDKRRNFNRKCKFHVTSQRKESHGIHQQIEINGKNSTVNKHKYCLVAKSATEL